ncbi:hypothetical protein GCM10016455_21250 [Aliiroseovarius zhejiangensis]|uniref:DUF1523 family protein n=1 Tax=Aliiroseovarius zhejiangensis TaxID=1632025 RepID=A0ABQ3J3Y6_9RHOB|nr:DUF1523 family protein [Aliiroseovarius zhejiangensis]GHF00117.1 hypothetical protein GCM10016455_21250 [Aliiroseovarius zhejiangensis]
MRRFRTIIRSLIFLILFGVFHYVLPQHDVVRVVNTYQERQDLGDWTRIFWAKPDDQSATLVNRDVQFIQTRKKKTYLLGFIRTDAEEVMVYRNEDTGWGWPFYFKFDTANLQTEADDLQSTAENPKWAVMTHYGWRNELISAFPNAVAIRPVASPDVTIIPWFNILFFIVLAAIVGFVRALWRQFRERSIDPALEDAGEAWDAVDERADAARGRFSRWLGSWRKK